MATPVIESAFTTGEVAPALFGNVALARMHSAAATMRNFFVAYQGGAYSRAGTAFVGFSKQTGRSYPPRLITFQFSINQGLALEFGNFYMRVIFDGALVTEPPASIDGITQANPGVISIGLGATSATPNDASVSATYNPGDTVTLAGGTFTQATVLGVQTTELVSITLATHGGGLSGTGSGYFPGCTINLLGGSAISQPILRVTHTTVVAVSINQAGSGGTPGAATITGTTGTGTAFVANVTINAFGQLGSINSITTNGNYSVNPNNLLNEPVTSGSGLSGATVALSMGVNSFTVLNGGSLTANPVGGNMTQAFSSSSGVGATFSGGIFGPDGLSVITPGIYTVTPINPVAQGSTSGSGVGATFNVTFTASATYSTGDWVQLSQIGGMTPLNGRTVVLTALSASTYSIADVYGNSINTTGFPAYTSGGIAARIFTLQTPYAEADLEWLKFTQSADVMSLCCVNQSTGTEYASLDLSRISDTDWTFTTATPAPSITPPTGSVTVAGSTTGSTNYQYVVTAVSPTDGTESVASAIGTGSNLVDIAGTAGTITVSWNGVAGVNEYNIYKASPGYTFTPPPGSLFGFAGSAYGTEFFDSNIVADFTQVPPLHKNPFARGAITGVMPVSQGSGYGATTVSITSVNGTGAEITAVETGGAIVAYIIVDGGSGYLPGDAVVLTGGGTGAAATLIVGPQTGTYPGVVAYFQQRRAYAYTLNQPDTYFMSQPGTFTNFDSRIPTIDSDAITGSPWSVEVNGIQFMIEVTGGLMVLTGLEAYFLAGAGSSPFTAQPLTPASQSAIPQGFNGCSPTVPPIRIYQDVLYLQAKGTTYRDFSFQIAQYTYTGEDITQNSTQLFNNYTIKEHAWCEEPYRVLWAVRNDGALLSLTWVKPEKVAGWARHDTNGIFQSVCSVTEPPVDALYLAVQRNIGVHTAYTIERMDDRLWATVEDAWCVDCGLSLPMTEPAATLNASSATGLGALTLVTDLIGGVGYGPATTIVVVDDNGTGPGTGAVAVPTIVGGVITAVTFTSEGVGYTYPQLSAVDLAGSAGGNGFSAATVLNNQMTFTASAAVFSAGDVGKVIRMGGGVATITGFTDSQHVTANITTPIASTLSDDDNTVIPQASGTWTMTTPITVVSGLDALDGATVTGLADGVAIPPTTVVNGSIVLGTAASQITVGLGFHARLQSVYLDAGEPTIQAKRGLIPSVSARIQNSGPFLMGSNQPDGSTLSPVQVAPRWPGMQTAPVTTRPAYNSPTTPLCTDDIRIPVNTGYSKHKQVCVEQSQPYPLEVLAFVVDYLGADLPSQSAPQKQKR